MLAKISVARPAWMAADRIVHTSSISCQRLTEMHCAVDVEYRAGNVACRGDTRKAKGYAISSASAIRSIGKDMWPND